MIHIWIKYEEKRENKYNAPISGFVADLLLFELVSLDVYLNYVFWFAVSEKLHRQYVKIVQIWKRFQRHSFSSITSAINGWSETNL